MKKLIAIWALGLILIEAVLFLLASSFSATLWITFGFVLFAFLSILVLWLNRFKKTVSPDRQILTFPALAISLIYLALQFPAAIIFSLGAGAIPMRITILVHIILHVGAWIMMIAGMTGNEHIYKVNSRQKNNHREL